MLRVATCHTFNEAFNYECEQTTKTYKKYLIWILLFKEMKKKIKINKWKSLQIQIGMRRRKKNSYKWKKKKNISSNNESRE